MTLFKLDETVNVTLLYNNISDDRQKGALESICYDIYEIQYQAPHMVWTVKEKHCRELTFFT